MFRKPVLRDPFFNLLADLSDSASLPLQVAKQFRAIREKVRERYRTTGALRPCDPKPASAESASRPTSSPMQNISRREVLPVAPFRRAVIPAPFTPLWGRFLSPVRDNVSLESFTWFSIARNLSAWMCPWTNPSVHKIAKPRELAAGC